MNSLSSFLSSLRGGSKSTTTPPTTTPPSTSTNTSSSSSSSSSSSFSSSKQPNYQKFVTSTLVSFLMVWIGVICIGISTLFVCKVAESGVLPDEQQYVPFTNQPNPNPNPTPTKSSIPIYQSTQYGFHGLDVFHSPLREAHKNATFTNMDSSYTDGILGWFQEKSDTSHNSFWKFYYQIVSTHICYNNYAMNGLMSKFSEYLPEWIILLFGWLVWLVFIPILFIGNMGMSILTHLYNFNELFRQRVDSNGGSWLGSVGTSGGPIPAWEDDSSISWFRMSKLAMLGIMTMVVPILPILCFLVVPLGSTLYTLLSPFFATFTTKGSSLSGMYTFWKQTLPTQQSFLLWVTIGVLLKNCVQELGPVFVGGFLVAVLYALFGLQLLLGTQESGIQRAIHKQQPNTTIIDLN